MPSIYTGVDQLVENVIDLQNQAPIPQRYNYVNFWTLCDSFNIKSWMIITLKLPAKSW